MMHARVGVPVASLSRARELTDEDVIGIMSGRDVVGLQELARWMAGEIGARMASSPLRSLSDECHGEDWRGELSGVGEGRHVEVVERGMRTIGTNPRLWMEQLRVPVGWLLNRSIWKSISSLVRQELSHIMETSFSGNHLARVCSTDGDDPRVDVGRFLGVRDGPRRILTSLLDSRFLPEGLAVSIRGLDSEASSFGFEDEDGNVVVASSLIPSGKVWDIGGRCVVVEDWDVVRSASEFFEDEGGRDRIGFLFYERLGVGLFDR